MRLAFVFCLAVVCYGVGNKWDNHIKNLWQMTTFLIPKITSCSGKKTSLQGGPPPPCTSDAHLKRIIFLCMSSLKQMPFILAPGAKSVYLWERPTPQQPNTSNSQWSWWESWNGFYYTQNCYPTPNQLLFGIKNSHNCDRFHMTHQESKCCVLFQFLEQKKHLQAMLRYV